MNRRVQELWLRFKAEGKKGVVLAALVGLCAALGLRAALLGKKPPKAAPAAAAAAPAQTQPVAPAGANPSAAAPGADAPVIPLDLSPPKRYSRGGPPTRDLYALNPKYFPDLPAVKSATGEDGAKSATGTDETSVEDAPAAEAEALRHRALADAATLRVRSVIIGARPAAVIEHDDTNGVRKAETLRVGDSVSGFVIAEITTSAVRVQRDGAEAILEVVSKKK